MMFYTMADISIIVYNIYNIYYIIYTLSMSMSANVGHSKPSILTKESIH